MVTSFDGGDGSPTSDMYELTMNNVTGEPLTVLRFSGVQPNLDLTRPYENPNIQAETVLSLGGQIDNMPSLTALYYGPAKNLLETTSGDRNKGEEMQKALTKHGLVPFRNGLSKILNLTATPNSNK